MVGVSLAGTNTISADPLQRATFLFVDRIDWTYNNSCYQAYTTQYDNVFLHLLIHELGHQRAGLTHPDEAGNNVYHQGNYPASPRVDVMWSNVATNDLRYYFPVFDQYSGATPVCNGLTCASNLHCNRVVP